MTARRCSTPVRSWPDGHGGGMVPEDAALAKRFPQARVTLDPNGADWQVNAAMRPCCWQPRPS
ncbi:hypothetical protein ABKW03_23110, partial [Enterobacter hormaechei]